MLIACSHGAMGRDRIVDAEQTEQLLVDDVTRGLVANAHGQRVARQRWLAECRGQVGQRSVSDNLQILHLPAIARDHELLHRGLHVDVGVVNHPKGVRAPTHALVLRLQPVKHFGRKGFDPGGSVGGAHARRHSRRIHCIRWVPLHLADRGPVLGNGKGSDHHVTLLLVEDRISPKVQAREVPAVACRRRSCLPGRASRRFSRTSEQGRKPQSQRNPYNRSSECHAYLQTPLSLASSTICHQCPPGP